VFIIVSTFFLMPIRIIGFFRMGHSAGWGTRAGAYTGGVVTEEVADEVERREEAMETPLDALEAQFTDTPGQPSIDTLFDFGTQENPESGTVLVKSRRQAKTAVAATKTQAPARRRLNPKAGWPYLIGAVILVLEALFIV
jgi:hypothetical protein